MAVSDPRSRRWSPRCYSRSNGRQGSRFGPRAQGEAGLGFLRRKPDDTWTDRDDQVVLTALEEVAAQDVSDPGNSSEEVKTAFRAAPFQNSQPGDESRFAVTQSGRGLHLPMRQYGDIVHGDPGQLLDLDVDLE